MLDYDDKGNVVGIAKLSDNERVRFVRAWDMAATQEELYSRDPAYTVGALMCLYNTGKIGLNNRPYWQPYILDIERHRLDPEDVATLITQVAKQDGTHVKIVIEQEPGSAGKTVISAYKKMLQGFIVQEDLPSGRKEVRATPLAQQFNAGNILVFKAPWNKEMLNEMGGFPFGTFKDQVDALAMAYKALSEETHKFADIKFMHL
jgi:predicted phage terminase large subunit-like protein